MEADAICILVEKKSFYRNATLQCGKSLQMLSQTCKCFDIKLTESIANKTNALQMQYSFICKLYIKYKCCYVFFTLSKLFTVFEYI